MAGISVSFYHGNSVLSFSDDSKVTWVNKLKKIPPVSTSEIFHLENGRTSGGSDKINGARGLGPLVEVSDVLL